MIKILGKQFVVDAMTNVNSPIIAKINANLLSTPNHPLNTINSLINKHFNKNYKTNFHKLIKTDPIVNTNQNFDSLLFEKDHPGRNKTDTYYINEKCLLRTHTSAHQFDTIASKASNAYLISADVYRRDEIDPTHYPVFHQMEGIRLFDRDQLGTQVEKLEIRNEVDESLLKDFKVQEGDMTSLEAEILGSHLRRSLEFLMRDLFGKQDMQIRWIDAFFPFTSPSWEMEVFYNGKWLELCGCGVMQQKILKDSLKSDEKIGWAFGLGLERIAMVLFQIPDIRLFWSNDKRFLSQFKQDQITIFQPFSKYPSCYKDISFWTNIKGDESKIQPDLSKDDDGKRRALIEKEATKKEAKIEFTHDNDLCDLVREVAGDLVEDVSLIDEFKHPKTGRRSLCYRINYRSMERTLANEEIDSIQDQVCELLKERHSIEIRG